jgi:crescentin
VISAPQTEALSDDVSHEIGARFETVSHRLDDAVDLFEKIQPLAQVIEQIRGAVQAEFQERRVEHGELLGLRAALEQTRNRLDSLEIDHREASSRLAVTEAELFDLQARADADHRRLEAAQSEEHQLRADLASASASLMQMGDSLRDALDNVGQLADAREALREQLAQSEDRRREADTAASRSNQDALLAQEELTVVRRQLETANTEMTRMTRQVAELESQLGGERARVRGLEASLASVQEESLRTSRSLDARLEATRVELTVANGKLETYLAQTARLEGLNADGANRLNAAQGETRQVERQLAELQTDYARTEERNRALDEELAALRVRLATVESARTAAVERSDQLSRQVHANEIALKRAEARGVELRDRLEASQSENAQRRTSMEERLSALESGLERERAERTIAEGALESLRRERLRTNAAEVVNG